MHHDLRPNDGYGSITVTKKYIRIDTKDMDLESNFKFETYQLSLPDYTTEFVLQRTIEHNHIHHSVMGSNTIMGLLSKTLFINEKSCF